MSILAVDPGTDAGWALFSDGLEVDAKPKPALLQCGLNGGAFVTSIRRAIIEFPMIYPGGRQKARPADVIKLAVKAGEWGGKVKALLNVDPEYVEPASWKGQVSKEVCHVRIWVMLDSSEKDIVDQACKGMAPSKRHNVLDAVGIGLWALGRLRR